MPPLERLSYYPGQKLGAADLNLEASYEITVRRLLMQGLFTAGVVSGLEVTKNLPRQVSVAHGIALDVKGRELFLADSALVDVPNQKPAGGGDSYYLVITYDEKRVAATDSYCGEQSGGALSRIRQVPQLAFTADWPNPSLCTDALADMNCGIVLAIVTLDNSCQVATIDTGVRQYSFPVHSSQVHEASYEGEKDVTFAESKKLYFHVRGGSPHSVILYLRGERFSTLYYTELGRHKHSLTATTGTLTGAPTPNSVSLSHQHNSTAGNNRTGWAGVHNHGIWIFTPSTTSLTFETIGTYAAGGTGYWDHNISVTGASEASWIGPPTRADGSGIPARDHSHSIGAVSPATSAMNHTHAFASNMVEIGDFGVTDVAARGGAGEQAHQYISDLTISLDHQDITANVLMQVGWKGPLGSQADFATDRGTGGIDLLRLPPIGGQQPPVIDEGPHIIEFTVNSGSGGKLLYNLYIE
jgi:hypothetical protein